MQVQLQSDPQVFRDLAEEWSALLRRGALDTLFLTPQWLEVWWRHFGAGLDLTLLLARDADGTLVGIAPLYAVEQAGQRVLQFVGGVDVSDYLDFIVAEGREDVYHAVVDYLLADPFPWDLLDLHCLPGDSPTRAGILCRVCQACCPGDAQVELEEPTPYIPLPGDWEAYLGSLDKKQRHEVRRKMRRIEREAEVRWHRLEDRARLDEEVDVFVQLHRASHPDKDAFMTEEMAAFFHDAAVVTFEVGWLSLYTLWLDGRPAASIWCFDYGDDLLVYNSGFDPEWRYHLSPGNVLMSYCIRDAIARGKRRFDFMRGGETYKYRLGAVDSAVYHLTVRHPGRNPARPA